MGDNLIQTLASSVEAKIVPLAAKVKQWVSWKQIRAKLLPKIHGFVSSLFNVRPRNAKDYFEVFGWLVSRRLAFAVMTVAGVLSLSYLVSIRASMASDGAEGIRTYAYDSIMLRFVKGKVRITGKGGYLAYEGEVEGGSATGYGTLYRRSGMVVYRGYFDKNRYQGSGSCYYDTGSMHYTGDFQENRFDGEGKLYRENGSLEYEGSFALGRKDGEGKLYDHGGNQIYSGAFSQDELVYSDLIGKKASEVAEAYTGKRILYEDESSFLVLMEDISVMYQGGGEGESLDGEAAVESVTVMKDSFKAGEKACRTIEELREYFGEEIYEGNSEATLSEAVALNWLADRKGGKSQRVEMELSPEYDDYIVVEDYDRSHTVYMYSFRKEGLLFTFICEDRDGAFSFYTIENEEEGAE